MATPWNFSYNKMYTTTKFNIQPSYTFNNLKVSAGTNVITGFLISQIVNLTIGMKVSFSGNTEFGTREISAINLRDKEVTFSGNPMSTVIEGDFYFYSNPGPFSEQINALTGQQLHNNFFYVAEGLTNHQERLTTLELQSTNAGEAQDGFIKYRGFKKEAGAFYTGSPLYEVAIQDFDTNATFGGCILDIAVNESINYQDLTSSIFYRITSESLTPFATPQAFCTYHNNRLINNGALKGFSLQSNAFSSTYNSPYDGNWDSDPAKSVAGFYILFDDAPEIDAIKITFDQSDKLSIINWASMAALLNAKFISAGISQKVSATQVDIGAGDLRLRIVGNNDRTHGTTRFKVVNISGGSFLEEVLRLDSDNVSAFDFSTMFQFTTQGNKIVLRGLNKYFSFVLKEGAVPFNLFSKAGFDAVKAQGASILYHTELPDAIEKLLNFDGTLRIPTLSATTITGTNGTITTLQGDTLAVSSLTATNATITTGNITTLTVQNLTSGPLIVQNTLTVQNDTTLQGTSINGKLFITNTDNSAYKSLYVLQVLDNSSPQIAISANKPKKDGSDVTALCYNGDMAVYNLDIFNTLRIHGTEKKDGRLYIGAVNPSSTTFTLNYDGNFRATTVNGTSSRKYKENIQDFKEEALRILNETKIVTFNFKKSKDTHVGFIAEDTHELLSGKNKDSMSISDTVAILIKAVQELTTRIDALERRL